MKKHIGLCIDRRRDFRFALEWLNRRELLPPYYSGLENRNRFTWESRDGTIIVFGIMGRHNFLGLRLDELYNYNAHYDLYTQAATRLL